MKTATYSIKMKDDTTQEVDGIIVNGIYGIDKRTTQEETQTKNGETKVTNTSAFCLTHIPTGILVTTSRTRKTLMELANLSEMTDLTDLTKMVNIVVAFWEKRNWKD